MQLNVHKERSILPPDTNRANNPKSNKGRVAGATLTAERNGMKSKTSIVMAALLAVFAGASAHALGQADTPELLSKLERGRWLLRSVGGGAASPVGQLCVSDPRMLAQIEHRANGQCSHFIVRSSPTSVTVSYSCKGAGQGLTTIRRETDALIQIQSQGINNGAPFSFSVEGRHGGAC
jgi:hypothetical protein